MAENKVQIATVGQFLGLRTDTKPSKCPAGYSPDCGDMIFTPGGMETRPPFLALMELPNEIVWRKEFTCKDGSVQVLALDVEGNLYSVEQDGTVVTIDTVAPGSTVSSWTAYGREYMAFLQDGKGCDAPRQWDGQNLYRVSQGAPGAAPVASNFTIAPSGIVSGTRSNNEVVIVTATPHQLKKGYLATLSGVDPFIQDVTTIVIDNETLPGVATVTTPTAHGLVPGNSVAINNVAPIAVGGGITNWIISGNEATVTMAANHGLTVGTAVLVEFDSHGFSPRVIDSVPSLNTFTFAIVTADDNGLTGSVLLPWPLDSGTLFTIQAVPSSTKFQISLNFDDGTWTTGTVTFDWDGAFYVEEVLSPTSFTYRQIGPSGDIASDGGVVTPTGQIPAGDHLVAQHFITKTGFITGPSPTFRFTASGGQYVKIDNLAIGPDDVAARVLSFTGANGSKFFMLLIPAQVNGLQISTSTRIEDNTTTSVIIDFSDITLLDATAIDVPGNNRFQLTALNTPRGVRWYADRLFWIGELNTVVGFLNLGMDGGTLSASTAPLGWDSAGVAISQAGFMPVLSGTGTASQGAATTAKGDVILQPLLNYSLRAWMGAGSLTAVISSASTGFSSTATIGGTGYQIARFSAPLPASIPDDLQLTLQLADAIIRDVQFVYADNPNRNPIARSSYLKGPEAYDLLTGDIGPNDDSTELRALFVLQESLHFITQRRLYSVQQIGNAEPSSWDVQQISDKCGAFHQEAVTTGKGWAAWGGQDGGFWFGGGIPDKTSAIIAPTWRKVASMTNIFDDSDAERVYFGLIDANGAKSMLAYDYHEVGLGGPGKWCPWKRPSNWICDSGSGPVFVFGQKFYELDTEEGIEDDDLGSIAGYYTFSPFGVSMFRKNFQYMGLRIAGAGVLTPFVFASKFGVLTRALRGQELSTLIDSIAEWTENETGRLMFLKLGQAGVRFALEEATIVYQNDANAPISGVR